jgi:hypothetical protein
LEAWTGNQPTVLLDFYCQDAFYLDPANPKGLRGYSELEPYLKKLLAKFPNWRWRRKELFLWERGFFLKWEAQLTNDREKFEGLDILELNEQKITRNEVYFDPSAMRP